MIREKLSDAAIIIAIFTALGYLIAHAFMEGMNSYYQLPYKFIELNLYSMTPILVLVYLIIVGVYVIVIIMKYLIGNSENLKVFTQLQFIKNLHSKLFFKELKSDINKGIKIIYIMIPLLFIIIIYDVVEYFGKSYASDQKEYLVIQKKEGLFVGLTSFEGLLVIAPLDVQKESMTPKFTTIEMKELKDAEVVYFENGLKVEDVKNINDFNK